MPNLTIIAGCLENIELAKERVLMRKEFKGHFIDSQTVEFKWNRGYKNLDDNYTFFDRIVVVDNSKNKELYQTLLVIENSYPIFVTQLPAYLKERLPKLFANIIKTNF